MTTMKNLNYILIRLIPVVSFMLMFLKQLRKEESCEIMFETVSPMHNFMV